MQNYPYTRPFLPWYSSQMKHIRKNIKKKTDQAAGHLHNPSLQVHQSKAQSLRKDVTKWRIRELPQDRAFQTIAEVAPAIT